MAISALLGTITIVICAQHLPTFLRKQHDTSDADLLQTSEHELQSDRSHPTH